MTLSFSGYADPLTGELHQSFAFRGKVVERFLSFGMVEFDDPPLPAAQGKLPFAEGPLPEEPLPRGFFGREQWLTYPAFRHWFGVGRRVEGHAVRYGQTFKVLRLVPEGYDETARPGLWERFLNWLG
jgi:hypothetical protein